MTIAEYVAGRLKRLGVRYVFGIPGGTAIPYIEAYQNEGIEYILVSHEASAGVMASVTARITGIPGVCHATSGPGATNLLTGVGGAYLDRSPVIAFTDEVGEKMLHRTAQMNIDHQKLFAPVTKATFRLDPSNSSEIIDRAEEICKNEYPGPVHIGLPGNVAGEYVSQVRCRVTSSLSDEFEVNEEAILALFRKSVRPLMAIGLTAARLMEWSDIISCIDRLGIPVVVTPMAKGMISESHPCYAGVLFHSMSNELKGLVEKSDLIIGFGYDQVEYNYESWVPDVPVINFNTITTDLPSGLNVNKYIGNTKSWVSLLDRIDPQNFISVSDDIGSVRGRISAAFEKYTGKFGPVTAIKVLQEELPPDSMLAADVGSHLHVLGQFWQTGGRKNLLMTNGWSGMGFGLPAAVAAQLSDRSSPVACVTGDGGFLMTSGEMMTARRYNLPVIVVVFSDGELNLIRLKKSWQNLSPYGTSLYSGDLFGSNSFLGVPVLEAASEASMRKALRSALKMKEPVIINSRIDPSDYSRLISAGV